MLSSHIWIAPARSRELDRKADLPLCAHLGRSSGSSDFSEADAAKAQLAGLSCAISGLSNSALGMAA